MQSNDGFNQEEIERIAKQFYNSKGEPVNEQIWKRNYKKLSEAIGKGYTTVTDEQDVRMNYELKNNVAVFAAFKSWRMGGDVKELLVDENGKKRNWGAFLKEYEKVNGDYNRQWLSAEYNLAQRQASAARQWQDFERDKSVYPNLEYMPSRSANPRDAHQQYYGVILPINDPFWNNALPPSLWNCMCWVKQSRAEPTTINFEPAAPPKGIVGNSGKTGMVFSPDHPYISDASKSDKGIVKEAFNQLKNALNEEYIDFKAKKGRVRVSLNADSQDYIENFKFGRDVVNQYPGVLKVNPHFNDGRKNPELTYKSAIGDRTQFEGENIKNFIKNGFKKLNSNQQLSNFKSVFLAFDFLDKLDEENCVSMLKKLKGEMNPEMRKSEKLQFVILKNNKNVVMLKYDDLNNMDKIKEELLK